MDAAALIRSTLASLLLLVGAAALAAPLAGRPAIQRFTPDLDVYPSAFSVAQDAAGIVYVGYADGLLSYDGSHWYAHRNEYSDLVRSMAMSDSGRLYIGGYDVFGYFETPVAPDAGFIDLSAKLGEEDTGFADVWHVLDAPEGVFFVALNHLFRYDPGTDSLQVWKHAGRFGAIARVDGRVVVQYRGEGLRVWDGEDFRPVPGTASLTEQIFYLVPLDAGGALTLQRNGRWQRYGADGVTDFPVPEGLPMSSEFNVVTRTHEGRIAMGTRDGHVWFFDPVTGEIETVRVSTDWISGLVPSREGGLIAQSDHETLHLRWPSRWTTLGPEDGLTGMVHEVLEWQGRWIAVTNGGVLARAAGERRFEPLGWTDFEAWDVEPLADGSALFAESYVLKHVDANGVIQSFDAIQYPRRILPSRFEPGLFYVGTEFGVGALRRTGSGWTVLRGSTEHADTAFTLIELSPGELLVGTDLEGAVRLSFDAERTGVTERVVFGEDRLEYGPYSSAEAIWIDGEPHVVTMGGVWRYVGDGFERLELAGLDALRRDNAFLSLVQTADGALWAWDHDHVYRYLPPNIWKEMDVAPLLRGAVASLAQDDRGRLLVGMLGGVLIHDPSATESAHPGLDSMLRSVEYRQGSEAPVSLVLDQPHALLPSGRYSLRFEYTLPGLEGRDDVVYQARLRGFENGFSEWDATDHYTYYDLRPGRYSFEARARDALGRITEIAPFEFEIVPPWYQTASARTARWVVFALALALLFWLLLRARLWRLEADRRRLSEMVVARTEALEAANRQLKQIAEVDELTGVANRRRLDAYLRRSLAECRRRHRTLSLALIDLDLFKPFNDRHGHLAGDRALRQVADCLRAVFTGDDQLVARFGGDEFVVVLPGADREHAVELARLARTALERCGLDLKFSIGIAIAGIGAEVEPGALIEAADRQMYVAKKAGRDGVSVTTIDRSSSSDADED